MRLNLEQKHEDIIKAPRHLLVTGGPGSGKTTIALLKAKERSQTLKPGQEILFLSFSRAAVRQILTACKDILTAKERKLIQVKTYHSFCLEVLESHGRLLSGRPVSFLYPSDERIRKSTFHGDWGAERSRLSIQEGLYCFDLFAPSVATLYKQCNALRTLYADKYPFVIVDEFQDTDDDQWRIIQEFLRVTDVFCLADPEQRIFEYRENVDPRRIESLRELVKPAEFDLGGDNHRSPATGILQFADGILHNRSPLPKANEVEIVCYYNRTFESTVHAVVLWTFSKLRSEGIQSPCVAVLCRSNHFVARLSGILAERHKFKDQPLRPVEHDVVWDADLSAASAQVVSSILEWQTKAPRLAVHDTLQIIAHYYRLKNAESPSKTAADNASKFQKAANAVSEARNPLIKGGKELLRLAGEGLTYVGSPVTDWLRARRILNDIASLNELFREARLVRLFRATDALATGLSDLWLSQGTYAGAADLVKRILDRERLLAADRDPHGCMLKTIHKSKGKEYDGVVLVEGAYESTFFDQNRERPPYPASRRLLRVGITRARSQVTLVRPHGAYLLVDP
ncbi:MAG: ATP-dependent helicase [Candidatus Tectomicrobia bacterium]|nr:ATP-dependent helicase [Candidatus Tectomicrobia bacterium]